jgi:hypothetical protein|tara:strand:+ start:156 stop:260 length:105 start_codon:yes stop_codon:yes gene_type:complete
MGEMRIDDRQNGVALVVNFLMALPASLLSIQLLA